MGDPLIGRAVEVRSINGVPYRGIVIAIRRADALGELFELASSLERTNKRLVYVNDRAMQVRAFGVACFELLIAELHDRGYEPVTTFGGASARFVKSNRQADVMISDDDEVTVRLFYNNRMEKQLRGIPESVGEVAATIIGALNASTSPSR